MEALILHARRDEASALAMAGTLSPMHVGVADMNDAATLQLGPTLTLIAVWSAQSSEDAGLRAALQSVAAREPRRTVVVLLNETRPPALPSAVAIATPQTLVETVAAVRAAPSARAYAPARVERTGGEASNRFLGAGMTMGLAIYAGMFVAAGAWRSEEVDLALETGRAPEVVNGALRTFQTAFGEDQRYHVAASASGRFGQTFQASFNPSLGARLVPVNAGLEANAGSAAVGGSLAPGLAAAGAATMGLASTGGFVAVSVNGNDAF